MAVFRPFLAILELKFRRSFWGAERAYILIGSKVTTQNTDISLSVFFNFVKNLLFV